MIETDGEAPQNENFRDWSSPPAELRAELIAQGVIVPEGAAPLGRVPVAGRRVVELDGAAIAAAAMTIARCRSQLAPGADERVADAVRRIREREAEVGGAVQSRARRAARFKTRHRR